MAMSEILIQQLIAFPTNAPSSKGLWLICPQRFTELTERDADYLTRIITESMDDLAEILVEEADVNASSIAMRKHLARPFVYAFGKGIEVVYNMKADPDKPVEFNLADLPEGAGDHLPEHLQARVTPAIPTVMMVFDETIDFAQQESTSSLDIQDLIKSILTGGMFLGVEFCLRQNVHDNRHDSL